MNNMFSHENGEACTTKESPSPTPQYPEDDFFYELLAEIRTR